MFLKLLKIPFFYLSGGEGGEGKKAKKYQVCPSATITTQAHMQ